LPANIIPLHIRIVERFGAEPEQDLIFLQERLHRAVGITVTPAPPGPVRYCPGEKLIYHGMGVKPRVFKASQTRSAICLFSVLLPIKIVFAAIGLIRSFHYFYFIWRQSVKVIDQFRRLKIFQLPVAAMQRNQFSHFCHFISSVAKKAVQASLASGLFYARFAKVKARFTNPASSAALITSVSQAGFVSWWKRFAYSTISFNS
jgi:hypothetical protein